ncbi:hypothetical protein ACWY4P_38800 [Streptomyces sp. LZ34]
MRITTSIATTAVAVLALTLTGCGGDDGDGKSASPAKDDKGASQSKDTGKPTPSSTGDSGDMKSSSPTSTPSRSKAPGKAPGKTATRAPGHSATSTPKAPTPSRTSVPSRPSTGGRLASVQGTWYYTIRDASGNLLTLQISGTSMTMSGPKGSCSGTISASLAISITCQGQSASGTAQVSNGGQNLALNWTTGNPDRFTRTKPA